MDVRISPLVELKEARSEIGWLRNRNLILAQALHDLQERMIVRAPPPADAPEPPDAGEGVDIITD